MNIEEIKKKIPEDFKKHAIRDIGIFTVISYPNFPKKTEAK